MEARARYGSSVRLNDRQPAIDGSAPIEILWLGDPACGDASRVGGKAASLSVLAARYRVPPGFCIPATALARWAPAESEHERAAPAELVDGVAVAYRSLAARCGATDPLVAVRSTAADEDGARASFAGQYETFLGLSGTEAVAEAVLRCWASMTSDRVASYRRRQGLPAIGDRLSVLVQQLVAADVAAVAFSANPVTGDRSEIVINASWGLGENIVGGSVTPDTYTVRKADWAIVQRSIAIKMRMTVPVTGGTREVDVPRPLQGTAALDDGPVVEVAQLTDTLETATGSPVDIECAYQQRVLFLLQCRPITTLPYLAKPHSSRET